MASLNRVQIIGNVGRDPETRVVPANNQQFTTISVATTDSWNDRNTNERREITEWHRVVFWGKQAETAARYVRKGSQVYVEGKLKTRKYNDKDGIERYTTEIVADVLQMLGPKPSDAEPRKQQATSTSAQGNVPEANNDVPF